MHFYPFGGRGVFYGNIIMGEGKMNLESVESVEWDKCVVVFNVARP